MVRLLYRVSSSVEGTEAGVYGQGVKETKMRVWYPGAGSNGKRRWREPDLKVIDNEVYGNNTERCGQLSVHLQPPGGGGPKEPLFH